MKTPPTILIVGRKSLASQDDYVTNSRSVFARICEPMIYLRDQRKIDCECVNEHHIDVNALHADFIIFSRHISEQSLLIAKAAKRKNIKVIYDIDDWIFEENSYLAKKLKNNGKNVFLEHLSLADSVVLSNQHLYEKISSFVKNNRIVIECGINIEKHYEGFTKNKTKTASDKIVYTNGGRIKLSSFKNDFCSLMNAYLTTYRNTELDFYTDNPSESQHFSRINLLGSYDWFEHKKKLLDGQYKFGIVPLFGKEDSANTDYCESKSPAKYIDYGALKIPGIYSRTPVYSSIITHGHNGLLVDNSREAWMSALIELSENESLREKIKKNAYLDVIDNYHISHIAKKWLELFDAI